MNDAKMLRNLISGMNDRPENEIYQDLINGFIFYSRESEINADHNIINLN